MHSFTISGNLIDIFQRRTYPAVVTVSNGLITGIEETSEPVDNYILPGFIDAHVHIESSMLVPTSFARMAVKHGTIATVSDPHEIANVCGTEGVAYMIADSKRTPFKFFFGAPSCVPATFFETAGAHIDAPATRDLLSDPDIWYLSEMMNYPGVLNKDEEVMAKIEAAKEIGKPIDGHAPGLMGQQAAAYAAAGITTDHECFTLPEALDKINAGMQIIIREGSAAKNYEALSDLLRLHPDKVMFCSDDKHPDDLAEGHINAIIKRSLQKGFDLYDVLRAASLNPATHYNLPVGLLRIGDPADMVVIDDPARFEILKTYIDGKLVAEAGQSLLPFLDITPINNFHAAPKSPKDFVVPARGIDPQIRVIEALEGQLITREMLVPAKTDRGCIISDVENDILKMVVVNRYQQAAPVSMAFIKNFGLKEGAIASTVAHDCHNIIAVGVADEAICAAVNALIACKGGISVVSPAGSHVMPLPVAGLMSDKDGMQVAKEYAGIDQKAKALGCTLQAPFMTLSFMALLVIPSLKLSDKGLFDGTKFEFTTIEV